MLLKKFRQKAVAFSRFAKKSLPLRAAFALAMAFAVTQINLDYAESYIYDLRVALRLLPPVPRNTALIFIRPSTILAHKGMPQASAQIDLLKRVLAQKPKAIVYDFNLNDVPGSDELKNEWEALILNNSNVFVGTTNTPMKGEEAQLYLKEPLKRFRPSQIQRLLTTLTLPKTVLLEEFY